MPSYILECKQCGGQISCEEGDHIAICPYCGTKNTIAKTIDMQGGLVNRANHLRRNNEFDKAIEVYEKILLTDNSDYEAHWGIVLCRYGIEYVEDPKTHQKIPTCHRTLNESIYTDLSYKAALEYAPLDIREVYEKEAAQIYDIQKHIIALSLKEEKYDVFICYKEADEAGERTEDSVIAQELEFELTKRGYKVFFARKTLSGKLGSAYEPIIFAALQSSRAMVVLGTKPEHFNSVWVKNEWSRYLELIRKGAEKSLIPAYRGMSPYDLPQEFSNLQALDMSKLGFVQDLCDGVDRLTRIVAGKAGQNSSGGMSEVQALLRRAMLFIEEGNYASGDAYLERVLDLNPEEPGAYAGKLMIEMNIRREDEFVNSAKALNKYSNYAKLIRFASPHQKAFYEDVNRKINERIQEAARAEEEKIKQMQLERAQEKKRQEELKIKKKKKRIKTALIIFLVIIGLTLIYAATMIIVQRINALQAMEEEYNSALELLENEQYYKAGYVFLGLDDYKDSAELYEEAYKNAYEQGIVLFNNEEYIEALPNFILTSKYKDSAEYLNIIALENYDNKQYGYALSAWEAGGSTVETDQVIIGDFSEIREEIGSMVSLNNDWVACIKNDGAVLLMLEHYDSYNKDRCPDPVYVSSVVSTWRGITDISAGYDAIVGIKKDGTAVSANIKRDDDPIDISEWSSLVSVDTLGYAFIGLKSNGTIVIEGSDKEGSSIISEEALAEIGNWSGIKTISINDSVYDRFAVGLKFNGTVIAAGSNEYGQCDVFSWKNIKSIITTANTTIGLRNDGTVAATGKNDNGQCEVDEWENIVSISANSTTTYGLKADGTVVAAGMQNSSISKLEGIVAIQARYSALYCLKSNGTVVLLYSDGNHSKPWDIGWTDIVFITCDEYSNLAGVKSDGTIVSYYGELTAIVGSEEDTIW